MRFQVPQFIDVEDKIFGPLTFKQFIYVAGGLGLIYVLWKLLPVYLSILLILPVGAFAFALAFVKINGKPFIDITEAALNYFLHDKLYIWKKEPKKKKDAAKTPAGNVPVSHIPRITESKLHDISWGLDVLDSENRRRES